MRAPINWPTRGLIKKTIDELGPLYRHVDTK